MVFIYCGAPIRLHVSINRVRVMEFNAAFNNISGATGLLWTISQHGTSVLFASHPKDGYCRNMSYTYLMKLIVETCRTHT
jgi:hypothetical protein